MFEIRFHGRGGQGAVIGSKVLAMAIFSEGRYVQSFPAFGVERRGAPVTAFLRVDNNPINIPISGNKIDRLEIEIERLKAILGTSNEYKKATEER